MVKNLTLYGENLTPVLSAMVARLKSQKLKNDRADCVLIRPRDLPLSPALSIRRSVHDRIMGLLRTTLEHTLVGVKTHLGSENVMFGGRTVRRRPVLEVYFN